MDRSLTCLRHTKIDPNHHVWRGRRPICHRRVVHVDSGAESVPLRAEMVQSGYVLLE